jgi:hypothetical protein
MRLDIRGWQALIGEHLRRRPLMEPQDVYKLLYQGILGPEHLFTSQDTFRERLKKECKELALGGADSLLEPVRPDGELVRVNLAPYLAVGGDIEKLVQACLETVNTSWGSLEFLKQAWNIYTDRIAEGRPDEKTIAMITTFTNVIENQSYPAVHHSDRYRRTYQPAYRLAGMALIEDVLPEGSGPRRDWLV